MKRLRLSSIDFKSLSSINESMQPTVPEKTNILFILGFVLLYHFFLIYNRAYLFSNYQLLLHDFYTEIKNRYKQGLNLI
jgi:hypothetical protein